MTISKGERQIIEMKVGCIELYGTVRSYKGVLTKYDSDTGKESQDNDDVLALFFPLRQTLQAGIGDQDKPLDR